MSFSYAGAQFNVAPGTPTADTQVAYEALIWTVGGVCSIRNVPPAGRTWTPVTDENVCATTNISVKGSSVFDNLDFAMSLKVNDAIQNAMELLEGDVAGYGAYRFIFPGNIGTYYFRGMVSMFKWFDGGGQNDIITRSTQILVHEAPVLVPVP